MYYTEPDFKSFDGTPLYVRVSGTGPLLLLIHGMATDADFFKDTGEYLSRWFTVVSYDRRGHVRSGSNKDHPKTMLETHVEDAAALIKAYGNGEPAYIIAHSLGGMIGMRLAEKYPEKIRSMILHEPAFPANHTFKHGNPFLYFPPIRMKDPRGREATEEELANIKPDTRAFFRYDWHFALKYRPKYEKLEGLPITVGVGTENKGTLIYKETLCQAKKMDAPVYFYPGVHNSGFDLPKEFAFLSHAIFTA